jgi:PAS domain S-box-containing protein
MLPHVYINVPALRSGTLGGYVLAFVSVGVAAALRSVADPYVVGVPFVTFWPAVIITALISGVGAGLFCVWLSAAAADFFVIKPHLLFYIENRADLADFLLFLALASFSVIIITQLHDAIEREQAERALRQSQERVQFCLNAARLGSWQYDPTRRVFSWDTRSKEILGADENEATVEEFMTWVHPDDVERVWADYIAALDLSEPMRFASEFRIRRAAGEVRWVKTWGLTDFDLEGAGRERRVTSVIGTVDDITEHKEWAEQEYLLKERLQFALDTAEVGWWNYDPRRLVASGDARFKEIFDVTADEIHIEEVRKLVHPDDAERFWEERSAMLDPTGPQRSTHEYRVQRRDGEVRWVRVCWLASREGAGRERRVASILGTVHDITGRKRREEHEHLVMRESSHRLKNLISVVDAIAHQTATKDRENFVERFSDRMQALSANQDLLVRSEWKGVEIEGLVRAQLAHFADLIGSRISADGPKLRLEAKAAQPIGLALHELATNAGKYGALSTDMGRVNIRWGAEGETFTMSWVERDGPAVSPPQRRGFGAIVMKQMAEHSLDGRVELDYAPAGVTWRLTCPAANVLEPSEFERAQGG